MKGLILLLPFFQLVWSLPHLKFTPEEAKAFQVALDGKKPLFISSALPLYSVKNVPSEEYVYLGIGDNSRYYEKIPYGTQPAFFPSDNIFEASPIHYVRPDKGFVDHPSSFEDFAFNNHIQNILVTPLFRHDLARIQPITEKRLIIRMIESNIARNNIRRKRQTDTYTEDENTEEPPVVYAEELGFGLSTAGGVLGGALGGYLDTTGSATLKLIKSLENLGLLAVGQLDTFLDQQEEEKKKKQQRQRDSYEAPAKI